MTTEVAREEIRNDLPEALTKILDAHGGMDNWQRQRRLEYTFTRGEADETQVVDLRNRREYIRAENMEMGYDGDRTWIVADSTYDGDPGFYRGLMFYFYAMPWVLADEGTNFREAEPLTVGGISYPGLHVSYDAGVGESPEDEYYLHYDPDTHEMRWLGYTVTYFTGEASDKISWIHYPTWTEYDGVGLADSLVWYTVEEGTPVAPRSTRVFSKVRLSEKTPRDERFAMREGAEVVE